MILAVNKAPFPNTSSGAPPSPDSPENSVALSKTLGERSLDRNVCQQEKIVDEIIEKNENQVNAYRVVNEKLFGFCVGQMITTSPEKRIRKSSTNSLKNKL